MFVAPAGKTTEPSPERLLTVCQNTGGDLRIGRKRAMPEV